MPFSKHEQRMFQRGALLQQRERERKAEVERAIKEGHRGLLAKHGLLHLHPDFRPEPDDEGMSPDQAWKKHIERIARERRRILEEP